LASDSVIPLFVFPDFQKFKLKKPGKVK